MIIAETPTEFAPESHEEDIEPARLPRRAPNAAAARRERQQAAPSSILDATSNDQVITQSGTKSAGGDVVNEDNGPAPAPLAKKPRQPRSRKRAAAESQIPGNELGTDAQAAKPKRQRKRQPKTPAVVTEGNDGAETVGMGGEAPGDIAGEQGVAAPKRPRSISTHLIFDEEDRENPEKTRIDATSMPMGVLTKDIPFVGTVSQREEALSKIDWDEEKRKRMEERERIAMGEEVAQTEAERDAALARLQEAANAASTAVQAPRMRVVNGNLVLDTTSTQVDRNARAREDAEELQEVEEDELTTRINQMSWIKANRKDPRERTTWGPTRADRWSNEQTEMFYDALKMFGTDFFIISKMFPGKTRANVKRKFVKEERLDPERIKRVLVGESVPMDFEEYKRKTGKDDDFFRDPEELRKELEQATEQQKQEVEEAQARYAEQQRQRKLAKQGGADFEGEEGEGGTGKKGKAKKKADGKKGKKDKVPIGGEEIEVVELDGDELEHRR
ncbi:SANT domain DNA binding protein [Macrophomina phaseolina MS6]|uniref:SANT domain DNA binding protein n=1 Tax=Macrophomina phaseolina (strain MS6) TaxID=1126212 RepID=K2RT85_MACPH|nr:SANT domain DNA binding protein [Macrophomina phaseolina MS6]